MKRIILSLWAFSVFFIACNNQTKTESTDSSNSMEEAKDLNDAKNINEDDSKFVTKAAETGMKEVELSRMAAEHGNSAEVKSFAQKMIDDHTKANDELKGIAEKKHISYPIELTQDTKDALDKLTKKSGKDFDQEYMDKMVSDHKDAVDLFQKYANEGKDQDLKNYAAKYLPALQSHMDMSQKGKDMADHQKDNAKNSKH